MVRSGSLAWFLSFKFCFPSFCLLDFRRTAVLQLDGKKHVSFGRVVVRYHFSEMVCVRTLSDKDVSEAVVGGLRLDFSFVNHSHSFRVECSTAF